MATVYVVHHEYEWCGRDELKFIGVFATRAEADAAIARLRDQPGFRDWPDGFCAQAWDLGREAWSEGFSIMVNIVVPSRCAKLHQGATTAWHRGDLYEICTLEDPSTAEFKVGQIVRCIEQSVDGFGKVLVATELVRDGV